MRKLPVNNNYTIDFSTNDYLGLAHRNIALEALDLGSTGSRLLSGNHQIFTELEHEIAICKKTEKALYFATGYQANLSCLSTLMSKKVLGQRAIAFFDKLNHASLYDAVIIAHARLNRYKHLQYDKLEEQLKQSAYDTAPKFIVSETVFGMDGDFADIERLIYLAKKYDAFLYLDEAHATGLYGEKGYGLSTLHDFADINYVIMGTMSKAIGASGGYIASSQMIIDYMINACRGFIYSTAPSPITAYIALQNWREVASMDKERSHLRNISLKLAKDLELNIAKPSNIFPLIIGENNRAGKIRDSMLESNIKVSCILPPTVPPGSARLRIALNARHTEADIEHLISVLKSEFN